MNSDYQKIELLKSYAKKASELIKRHEFIRVFTHYDADGISAGAIIAKALLRINKNFQISFLKGLNESFEYEKDELVMFLDMGSGYPDVISNVEADVIIADHHIPTGEIEPKKRFVHVNPHLVGIDGTYELSASGATYFIARELGRNEDLSCIAVVGMLGDKQKISSANAEIVKEGEKAGFIERKIGLNLHSGKVKDVLKMSLEPYLDFYKKEDELEEFLKKIEINGEMEVDKLSLEEMHKLADAIALRMLRMGAYISLIDEIIGERLWLNNMPRKNALMLTDIVNACGRASAMSVGLALLMGDSSYLKSAVDIYEKYTKEVLEELVKRRNDVKEGFCMRYIVMENAPSTSPIATTYSRYLYSDKPLIVVNVKDDRVKVSARANEKLAERLNLAEVMRLAAEKVGGRGGGHRVAAGANISPDKVEEFLKEVDRLCCAMLA